MSKDWTIGSGYCEEPKVTEGPGITKDGSAQVELKLKQLIHKNLKQYKLKELKEC